MSLIIIKVDRENKTHSIYGDGICVSDGFIVSNKQNKIGLISSGNTSILIGTTGEAPLGFYIRTHLKDFISDFDPFYLTIDEQISKLVEMFELTLCDFLKKHKYNDNYEPSFYAAISVNGYLYTVRANGLTFDVQPINGDYCAVGYGEEVAYGLLDNDIPIQKIYDTISKRQIYVNNVLSLIDNVNYNFLNEVK